MIAEAGKPNLGGRALDTGAYSEIGDDETSLAGRRFAAFIIGLAPNEELLAAGRDTATGRGRSRVRCARR